MTEAHLLSVPEAAERLGIDVRLARKMLGWGQLPAVKIGSRQMVPEDAVPSSFATPRRRASVPRRRCG